MKLHTLLKATTTTREQGKFSAVISAVSVDREGDRVDPDAMVRALKRWASVGKDIPLVWNHSDKAEMVVGGIYPDSAKAVDGEVHVDGWVDQNAKVGGEVWRLVKSGTLGFSFGYLIPEGGATPNQFGGKDITELDVFEATATPTPMNNDTRVTGWKALTDISPAAAESIRQRVQDAVVDRYGSKATVMETQCGGGVVVQIADGEETRYVKAVLGVQGDEFVLGDEETELERTSVYRPKGMDLLRARADAVALEVATGGEEPAGQSQAEQHLEAFTGATKAITEAIRDQDARVAEVAAAFGLPAELTAYLEGVIDAHEEAVKKAEEKSVDVTDPGDRVRSVDPLRAKADAVALAVAMGDTDLSDVKAPTPAPKPEPALPLSELKRRTREATLNVLTGGTES